MSSRLSTERLARASAEHPKRVLAIWAGILIASAAVIASLLSGVLSTDQKFLNNPESMRATDQLTALGRGDVITESVVLTTAKGSMRDPAKLGAMDALAAKIGALGPDVVARVIPPSAKPDALVSKSGTSAVMSVTLTGDLNAANKEIKKVQPIVAAWSGTADIKAEMAGIASFNRAVNTQSEEDLKTGESIGIMVGLLILVIVFGALVSALVPVALALVAITVALALTALVGQFGSLSFFVTNMITMMGLAVGIDYALFIISRYREERARGVAKLDAIEHAGATSSRAVFFSGMSVVVALAGLLVVPMSVFVSLALGAILVALAAVVAALTFLPALLSLFGDRINAGRLPRFLRFRDSTEAGFWGRLVHAVMRRPGITFAVTALLLVVASLPYWGMNTGASGVSALPPDLPARQAFETLKRDFSVGQVSPVRIPVLGEDAANDPRVAALRTAAAANPAFGPMNVTPSTTSTPGVSIDIPLLVDSASRQAERAVRDLRTATDLPVGGGTAFNIDYFDLSSTYLPIVVALVLGFSFIVLLLAFRSVVASALAIFLNLLSVGAAFGVLTLVMQDGWGADLLGFQQVETIEAWIPIFLFAVLFGLSMDYHVFLLSRIRERFLVGRDNEKAIVYGISSSARLITGAALIMVAVFGGFAAGKLVMFQQMGFGLAVAILVDATLVRGILVPATMRLLGRWNWYLPRWLAWLPKVSIEGPVPTTTAPAPTPVAVTEQG